MMRYLSFLLFIASVVGGLACGETDRPITVDDGDNGSDADGDNDDDGDDDDDSAAWDDDDDDDDTEPDTEVCAEDQITLKRLGPRVMFLEDKSGSMTMDETDENELPWEQTKMYAAVEAITAITEKYDDDIDFGFDVYPNNDFCRVQDPVVLDTAENNAQNIIDYLNQIQAVGGTPIYDAMNNFLNEDYAPEFTSLEANSYLVVVTDGKDTCGINGNMMNPVQPDDLAALTTKLLDDLGIKTIAIGFAGNGIDPNQLNAIAENGGTEFTEYFEAENQSDLIEAIEKFIETMVSCIYEIEHPDEPYVNLEKVNFYFDEVDPDNVIPHDENCAKGVGWTWRNPPENTVVEFCDEPCETLQSDDIKKIWIQYGCDPIVPE